jgi:hypothetical protein
MHRVLFVSAHVHTDKRYRHRCAVGGRALSACPTALPPLHPSAPPTALHLGALLCQRSS